MNKHFTFTINSICLDENYHPSDKTRITTNFANLARGSHRQANLRNALKMIDNSFNALGGSTSFTSFYVQPRFVVFSLKYVL